MNRFYLALILVGIATAGSTSAANAVKASESIEMDPFDVTANPANGYMATNAISGTAMNMPLREVPMAINVITSEFLDDSLVGGLNRVFDYNSSITQTFRPQTGNTNARFSIRGFLNRNLLVDGVMGGHVVPTYMIDRVEVVKGPNTLYGQSDPGGLINIVTKRPGGKGAAQVTQKIGQQALRETIVDVDMPRINNQLNVRVLGAYRESVGWRPADGGETRFIGLMADYDLTPNTRLLFHHSDTKVKGVPTERGTWAFEQIPTDLNADGVITNVVVDGIRETTARYNNTFLPRNWSSATHQDYAEETVAFTQIGIRHRFNEAVYLQYGFSRSDMMFDILRYREMNTFSPAGVVNAQYGSGGGPSTIDAHTLNIHLDLFTGPLHHRILLGGRHTHDENSFHGFTINGNTAPHRAILQSMRDAGRNIRLTLTKEEVLAGVRIWEEEMPTTAEIRSLGTRGTNINYATQDIATFYLTDNMAVGNGRLKLIGGVRHVKFEDAAFSFEGVRSSNPINRGDTSIQFGAVYDLTANLNVFSNYATAYNPNRFNPNTEEFFPPEESTAYEVGFKFENLWSGRMGGSVSYFNIRKENVLRSGTHPIILVPFTELSNDEATGIETELFFNISDNWNTVINYSNLDAKTVESLTVPVGLALEGAPPDRLTFWTSYHIDRGPLNGLRFGGGIVWANGPIQQFNNSPDRLVVEDGYSQVDLFARYGTNILGKDVTFGVNVDNVNDVFYMRARAMTNTPRQTVFFARIDL